MSYSRENYWPTWEGLRSLHFFEVISFLKHFESFKDAAKCIIGATPNAICRWCYHRNITGKDLGYVPSFGESGWEAEDLLFGWKGDEWGLIKQKWGGNFDFLALKGPYAGTQDCKVAAYRPPGAKSPNSSEHYRVKSKIASKKSRNLPLADYYPIFFEKNGRFIGFTVLTQKEVLQRSSSTELRLDDSDISTLLPKL